MLACASHGATSASTDVGDDRELLLLLLLLEVVVLLLLLEVLHGAQSPGQGGLAREAGPEQQRPVQSRRQLGPAPRLQGVVQGLQVRR